MNTRKRLRMTLGVDSSDDSQEIYQVLSKMEEKGDFGVIPCEKLVLIVVDGPILWGVNSIRSFLDRVS